MSTDAEQDRLILDSVGRFLEREVQPHVHALEHDDIYPEDIVVGTNELQRIIIARQLIARNKV